MSYLSVTLNPGHNTEGVKASTFTRNRVSTPHELQHYGKEYEFGLNPKFAKHSVQHGPWNRNIPFGVLRK